MWLLLVENHTHTHKQSEKNCTFFWSSSLRFVNDDDGDDDNECMKKQNKTKHTSLSRHTHTHTHRILVLVDWLSPMTTPITKQCGRATKIICFRFHHHQIYQIIYLEQKK